jgi:hypothetical protein
VARVSALVVEKGDTVEMIVAIAMVEIALSEVIVVERAVKTEDTIVAVVLTILPPTMVILIGGSVMMGGEIAKKGQSSRFSEKERRCLPASISTSMMLFQCRLVETELRITSRFRAFQRASFQMLFSII